MYGNSVEVDIFNLFMMSVLVMFTGFIAYELYRKYLKVGSKGAYYLMWSSIVVSISSLLALITYVNESSADEIIDAFEFSALTLAAISNIVNLYFLKEIFDSPSDRVFRFSIRFLWVLIILLLGISGITYTFGLYSLPGMNVVILTVMLLFIITNAPLQLVIFIMIVYQCSRLLSKIEKGTEEHDRLWFMRIWAIFAVLFALISAFNLFTMNFTFIYGLSWSMALISTYGAFRTYISRKK